MKAHTAIVSTTPLSVKILLMVLPEEWGKLHPQLRIFDPIMKRGGVYVP